MMRARGFSLVEMVVAITISAILMGTIAMIMGRPVDAYIEQSRRSELIDTSDRIGRLLGNDLSKALPNSVRIQDFGNTKVVQMLEVSGVFYYKDEPSLPSVPQAATGLKTGGADSQFQLYGGTSSVSSILAVNDTSGAAYGATNSSVGPITTVMTPGWQAFTAHDVLLATSHQFSAGSPTNRVFAIKNDAPITYICNLASGRLTRFAAHTRNPSMPANESAAQLAGAQSSVIATGITACAWQCAAMSGNRCQQTLTFSATATRGVAPETDRVLVIRNFRVEDST